MNTPLTEEQRELLSAYADGEVTAAERQAAEQLLQRADAREYFDSLQATITLVKTHAPLRAPVGLSGRVLNALEDEFKPKAIGPGSEPFTGTPVISWRTPLYAIAAAVIVSLGIMFGPSLVGPREGTPSEVARTVLDDLPAPKTDARPAEYGDHGFADEANDVPNTDPANPADALNEKAGKDSGPGEGGSWDGAREDLAENLRETEASRTGATLKQPEANAAKKAKDSQGLEGAPSESKGASRGEDAADDKNALNDAKDVVEAEPAPGNDHNEDESKELGTKSDHEKYNGRAGAPPMGGGTGGSAQPKPERRNQDGANQQDGDTGAGPAADESEEEEQRVKRARSGGGSAPEAAEAAEAGEAETLVEISDARTLTAQTDVLWVSSLYGDAALADEDSDVESVTVEIDADKLPELMAALRKLAADQGYGTVAGNGEDEKLAERKAEAEPRISGYLPSDEEAEQPQPEAILRAPAKVRVVIRLQ